MFEKLGQFASLMRNLPKLQEETEKFKQSIGQLHADGEAGAGMVKVRVNGRREVVRCELSDEALQSGDKELLEDLIKAATNQAMQKVSQLVAEEAAKLASNLGLPGGMGMGLPGMS